MARALGCVVDPEVLRIPLQEFHDALQKPLRLALRDHGDPHPDTTADIIDSMMLGATQEIRARKRQSTPDERDAALSPLRRLLAPYLGLEWSSTSDRGVR